MSLKKNIIANYASQFYVTGVGILILPLYIQHMGAEAYGLIGFFTMLQAWFSLLDIGLTPTIGRETARYHGGSMTALAYRRLFRALSLIFLGIAMIGGGALWILADEIAAEWLNVEFLDINEVVVALKVMAISVALRWMCGLYRGIVTGSERMVWLSAFNTLIATLRFVVVFASMWLFGFTPLVFFMHQLAVALLELLGLWWMGSRLLPSRSRLNEAIGWSFQPIKAVLKFALTIAFTSSIWVLVTQTDKLILSGILPLSEYGFFTLAVLAASGIMIISGPISSAIMPRMARLHAENKHGEMIQIYRNATQLVSIIAGSAAITIAFCAEPLLYAWTGNNELSQQAAPILRLYAIGNAFLAVGAFPYYLQYALGDLRYHLIGSTIIFATLIPSVIWAAMHFGGIGAGYAWFSMNSIYFVFWVAYVHRKLKPGLHLKWLLKDCLIIYLPVVLFFLIFRQWLPEGENRGLILFYLAGMGFIAFSIALGASGMIREKALLRLGRVV